jgi:hypothetical protein
VSCEWENSGLQNEGGDHGHSITFQLPRVSWQLLRSHLEQLLHPVIIKAAIQRSPTRTEPMGRGLWVCECVCFVCVLNPEDYFKAMITQAIKS